MHQQIHCHTLPKPFSQIFLFRIYAPTNTHTTQTIDPAPDETSDRHPQIHAPNQPTQINPQRHRSTNTHAHTVLTNKSTNDHTHANSTPAPTNACRASFHRYTRPQTLDAEPAPVDVDAAPMPSQPRCTRSHAPVRNWTGQTDRIRSYKTRPDRIRPPIHN